jgi:hypothetical protein
MKDLSSLLNPNVPLSAGAVRASKRLNRLQSSVAAWICSRPLARRIWKGSWQSLRLAANEPEATTWVKIKNRGYSQAEGRDDFFDERARKLAVADLTDES